MDTAESGVEPVDRIALLTTALNAKETTESKLLKAHIAVLASALGGPDHTADAPVYKLGHDALACVKDLKRWIRSVDGKNTYDVALACAACGLVQNDLTVILCQWDSPKGGLKKTKTVEKVMLGCLELLVLLTWPIEVTRVDMASFTARSNAKRAQLAYKHHILRFNDGKTFKAVIRMGLAALKTPFEEREPRDNNIIRLILFFIRNILYIEPSGMHIAPKGITSGGVEGNSDDIDLNAVVAIFKKNRVLPFITSVAHSVNLTLASNLFGPIVIECLSLLTRGVQIEQLLNHHMPLRQNDLSNQPVSEATVAGMELLELLSEEEKRKRTHMGAVSTRHGRFGTLLSLKSSEESSSFAVSGQQALAGTAEALNKLDKSKAWHAPVRALNDSNEYLPKTTIHLTLSASLIFKEFVELLLSTGALNSVLRYVALYFSSQSLSSETSSILTDVDKQELASYFLTVEWFLHYKRERHKRYTENQRKILEDEDLLDYSSVSSALDEVNFVLLISYFTAAVQTKDHNLLHVAIRCLHELLLISHSIFVNTRKEVRTEEDIDQDRELAEGIIRRLFSQQHFLNFAVRVPRTAAKFSFEFLSITVSFVHILLKSFESLASEDFKLYIRSRRKISKFRKSGLSKAADREHWLLIDRGSDDDDEEEFNYITRERKLNFEQFVVKLLHTDTVSTHIAYLDKFEDLKNEEIKRGLAFFHRLFVVRKDHLELYRLDFMTMLHRLRLHVRQGTSIRRHVDEFVTYFMKKFKQALEREPTMIEVLFPPFLDIETRLYLSFGDITTLNTKITKVASRTSKYYTENSPQPKAAPVLQFVDDSKTTEEKTSIALYHLRKTKAAANAVKFLVTELRSLALLKLKGEKDLRLMPNLTLRRIFINNEHLRLLLTVLGFDLPYLQNDEATLQKNVSSENLTERAEMLEKWSKKHEENIGDIEPFLDQTQIRYFSKGELDIGEKLLQNPNMECELSDEEKAVLMGMARRKAYDESYESESDIVTDDDFQPAPKRRKGLVEEEPAPKRHKELKSLTDPPKSAELVYDSDDESDDEATRAFFEREERLRRLISDVGGIADKSQLGSFKESWLRLLANNESAVVRKVVDRASELFVALDDES